MSKNKYISKSGKNYKIEGDYQSGYRAKDLDNNQSSVYGTEEFGEMKRHIEDVEIGKTKDVGNFGKHKQNNHQDDQESFEDYHKEDEEQDNLRDEFESGNGGVMASLTENGYEYYRG